MDHSSYIVLDQYFRLQGIALFYIVKFSPLDLMKTWFNDEKNRMVGFERTQLKEYLGRNREDNNSERINNANICSGWIDYQYSTLQIKK
jgi:hypothetical protein